MIFGGLIKMFSDLVRWLCGLVPEDALTPLTSVVPTVKDVFTPFATGISSTTVWIPWDVLIICVGITFSFWSVIFALRFIRWAIGLIPTMSSG